MMMMFLLFFSPKVKGKRVPPKLDFPPPFLALSPLHWVCCYFPSLDSHFPANGLGAFLGIIRKGKWTEWGWLGGLDLHDCQGAQSRQRGASTGNNDGRASPPCPPTPNPASIKIVFLGGSVRGKFWTGWRQAEELEKSWEWITDRRLERDLCLGWGLGWGKERWEGEGGWEGETCCLLAGSLSAQGTWTKEETRMNSLHLSLGMDLDLLQHFIQIAQTLGVLYLPHTCKASSLPLKVCSVIFHKLGKKEGRWVSFGIDLPSFVTQLKSVKGRCDAEILLFWGYVCVIFKIQVLYYDVDFCVCF